MPEDQNIRDILTSVKTIAVVGWSPKADRASHRVAAYLAGKGYHVIPVNPGQAGQEALGTTVRASLAEAGPVVAEAGPVVAEAGSVVAEAGSVVADAVAVPGVAEEGYGTDWVVAEGASGCAVEVAVGCGRDDAGGGEEEDAMEVI